MPKRKPAPGDANVPRPENHAGRRSDKPGPKANVATAAQKQFGVTDLQPLGPQTRVRPPVECIAVNQGDPRVGANASIDEVAIFGGAASETGPAATRPRKAEAQVITEAEASFFDD